jgi:hypothetical protein
MWGAGIQGFLLRHRDDILRESYRDLLPMLEKMQDEELAKNLKGKGRASFE